MTRRQRHIRILDNFGERRVQWELDRLLARNGLALFTDEAIEALATAVVHQRHSERKMHADNRKIIAARDRAA